MVQTLNANVIGRKLKRRRPREDFAREVPRGAGGTSVYARTRARAALVRRRRVTDLVKTRSIMRGDIEGTSRGVNIVSRQYCEQTTGGVALVAGIAVLLALFDLPVCRVADPVVTLPPMPHVTDPCNALFRVCSNEVIAAMA
jgi:hypothetical protein